MFPDVVVLAGGRGTRLRSVVSDRPKVLAPVSGRPFLAHLLDWVARAGGRRVVLSVGYLAGSIQEAICECHGSLEISYVIETEPLGTAGGLANAASAVVTDTVVVLNGDSIVLADLPTVVRRHEEMAHDITMVAVRVRDCGRFGSVRSHSSGRVEAFDEKGTDGPGDINAGVYVMGRTVMANFRCPASLERDVLPALARQGRVHLYRCNAPFIDIGTPESYALLQAAVHRYLPEQ